MGVELWRGLRVIIVMVPDEFRCPGVIIMMMRGMLVIIMMTIDDD